MYLQKFAGILLITLLHCNLSFSQSIQYGLKAGGNISSITSFGESDYQLKNQKYMTDFYAGITTNVQLNNEFSIGFEGNYSRQGTKTNPQTELTIGDIITQVQLHHIQIESINIPLTLKYSPIKGINFFTGIQPGFVISANETISTKEFDDFKEDLQTDGNLQFGLVNDFDLSIPIGLSYQLEKQVFIDARYNLGTNHVFEHVENRSLKAGKNSVFQVGINYLF